MWTFGEVTENCCWLLNSFRSGEKAASSRDTVLFTGCVSSSPPGCRYQEDRNHTRIFFFFLNLRGEACEKKNQEGARKAESQSDGKQA